MITKKKMFVIDYIGNSFENKPIGHPIKVITQVIDLLSDKYDIKTVLPTVYKNLMAVDIELSRFCDISKRSQKFYKLKSLYKKLGNLKDIFKINDGLLFFVNVDFIIYLFIAISSKRKSRNIVIINYCDYINMKGFIGNIKKKVYSIAKEKILLELNTYDYNSAKFIPDYYYTFKEKSITNEFDKVDFLVIGTMNEAKDIVSIIKVVGKSKYKLKIIGKFYNEEYFEKIENLSRGLENVNVVNKYLDAYEYKSEIINSRYIVLPYNVNIYSNLTSGVFLDALYNHVPIICPSTKYFNQFRDLGIGIVYNDMSELIQMVENDNYHSYKEKIECFNLKLSKEVIKEKIVSLLEN